MIERLTIRNPFEGQPALAAADSGLHRRALAGRRRERALVEIVELAADRRAAAGEAAADADTIGPTQTTVLYCLT
jgi:hypothetical protein